MSQREPGHRWLHLRWESQDALRLASVAAAVGLGVAVAMAVAGLPPVDLHGPLHRMGIMDPLCGGTRAARLTMRGDLAKAWKYNPLGILAAMTALLGMVRLGVGVTTRRWLNVRIVWTPSRKRTVIGAAVALLIVLEVRQQGRSELLMRRY